MLAVEVIARTDGAGVLWCDGRRTVDLPPGARIEVRRGRTPVRLVRLHQAPFTDRLVAKFDLPVAGWRGAAERRRRDERRRRGSAPCLRSCGSARSGSSTSRCSSSAPGSPRSPARPAPARRWSSPRSACCSAAAPTPAPSARVPGRRGSRAWSASDSDGARRRAVDAVGGEVEDGRLVLARQISAEGRSRAFAGGASVPVSTLAALADPLVAVHGQSDQHRLLRPAAQRDALDSFAGAKALRAAGAVRPAATPRCAATEAELADVVESARERAREADLLRFGLGEVEAVDPQPGEDAALAAEEAPARLRRHPAHRRRAGPRVPVRRGRRPDALGTVSAARKLLDGVREHDPEAAGLADRLAEVSYLLSDVAADVASYASGLDTDPARLAARLRAPGRAGRADPQVRRDRSRTCWPGPSTPPRRLLELDGTDERIVELTARSATGSATSSPPSAADADRRPGPRRPTALGERGHRRARLAGDAARPAERRGHPEPRTTQGLPVGRPHRCGSARPGVDDVELLLAANRGAEPRPLGKGASGRRALPGDAGGRGRARGDRPGARRSSSTRWTPGSGGKAAVEVGRRLALLARHAQVAGGHPPAPGRRLRRPARRGGQEQTTARSPPRG